MPVRMVAPRLLAVSFAAFRLVSLLVVSEGAALAHDAEPMSPGMRTAALLTFTGVTCWLLGWAYIAVRQHRAGQPPRDNRLVRWFITWLLSRPMRPRKPGRTRGRVPDRSSKSRRSRRGARRSTGKPLS